MQCPRYLGSSCTAVRVGSLLRAANVPPANDRLVALRARDSSKILMPRSLAGDAERDFRKMGPANHRSTPGSIPAYVPNMGKQLDG